MTTKPKKRGRPTLPPDLRRDHTLRAMVTRKEYKRAERHARPLGGLSDWIRRLVNEATK